MAVGSTRSWPAEWWLRPREDDPKWVQQVARLRVSVRDQTGSPAYRQERAFHQGTSDRLGCQRRSRSGGGGHPHGQVRGRPGASVRKPETSRNRAVSSARVAWGCSGGGFAGEEEGW